MVGVNYRNTPWPNFGGNFWWADPSYVRSLILPEVAAFPEGDFDFVVQTGAVRQSIIQRLNFERWIGLGAPRAFSFYGHPFKVQGLSLDFHDLSSHDIEPYYRHQEM